jgi:hypothetical protein
MNQPVSITSAALPALIFAANACDAASFDDLVGLISIHHWCSEWRDRLEAAMKVGTISCRHRSQPPLPGSNPSLPGLYTSDMNICPWRRRKCELRHTSGVCCKLSAVARDILARWCSCSRPIKMSPLPVASVEKVMT